MTQFMGLIGEKWNKIQRETIILAQQDGLEVRK
jgi:hypothetical protein